MKTTEIDIIANMFRQQCEGNKLTQAEIAYLMGILDRMNAAERAGSIAAIIRIMIGAEGEKQ